MNEQMSVIGDKLKIGIYGASHGEKIGVKIAGFPCGFKINKQQILLQMSRRAPGNSSYATARKEPDFPNIVSGVDENGITNGEIIEAVIINTNQHSSDYNALKFTPRPGHADYTAYEKFDGKLDMRGGGKFSGRLTAPLVFAGALCEQWLNSKGISICAHVSSIKNITDTPFDPVCPDESVMARLKSGPFPVIDDEKKQEMLDLMKKAKSELDSVGGTVECIITGVPVGVGDSLFDGIEGKISQYIFGIPAVKGVQFGKGFDVAGSTGSENNDEFMIKNGKVVTKTNNCGGILGGISNGMPIIFKAAFKPTPSISRVQNTVDLSTMTDTTIEIKGRHDPCIVPRAAVCVEAATAVAMADLMMINGRI